MCETCNRTISVYVCNGAAGNCEYCEDCEILKLCCPATGEEVCQAGNTSDDPANGNCCPTCAKTALGKNGLVLASTGHGGCPGSFPKTKSIFKIQ